jgi:hypothetical protein
MCSRIRSITGRSSTNAMMRIGSPHFGHLKISVAVHAYPRPTDSPRRPALGGGRSLLMMRPSVAV